MKNDYSSILYSSNEQVVVSEGLLMEEDLTDTPLRASNDFVPHKAWLRWPLLFLFVNCIMTVSAFSLCLSPASGPIAVAYSVPDVEVNMCGIIFTATFVPMTFVAMWMYKNMRSHTVLRISCVI